MSTEHVEQQFQKEREVFKKLARSKMQPIQPGDGYAVVSILGEDVKVETFLEIVRGNAEMQLRTSMLAATLASNFYNAKYRGQRMTGVVQANRLTCDWLRTGLESSSMKQVGFAFDKRPEMN